MLDYKNYITELADNKKDTVFFNSGPYHASYVMENIFRNASTVNIFAGSLSGHVSGKENYQHGLRDLWQRGGKINILLQTHKRDKKEDLPLFPLLKYFKLLKPESIEIKQASINLVQEDEKSEFHFMTGDDCMYRLENNIETFSATGNFNDPITVKKLNETFNEMFKNAETIEL